MAISSIELRRWPTASDIALLTSTTRSTLAAITCACQALMPEPSSDSPTRVPKPKASRRATEEFLRSGRVIEKTLQGIPASIGRTGRNLSPLGQAVPDSAGDRDVCTPIARSGDGDSVLPEPVHVVAADAQRLPSPLQVHLRGLVGPLDDLRDEAQVDDRRAVDLDEGLGLEAVEQLADRLADQRLAAHPDDQRVLLVGAEVQHLVDRDQLDHLSHRRP